MTEDTVTVLVVDDDPQVRSLLSDYLSEHGYAVIEAASGAALREAVARQVPQVVLLDVGLPGEDGLSLARFLREQFDLGIIIVSGAGETVDRIVGLEVGADDYITKPFDPRELRARLKSVLRRYQRPSAISQAAAGASVQGTRRVVMGRCQLDLDTRQLLDADGGELPLTAMEFDLLNVFAARPNRPLSRDQLMQLTRNREWDPADRSIDIHMTRLRRKLEVDPEHPRVLRTVRGVGYMYVPAPVSRPNPAA
ncbi:DNA-binding response regulator [Thioalkalivibrio denitrificans]|uniref:DNA-binding response regulator n=1 Tax=Thioalkalivibrio denitrificans TaxID=108003 RepID=A0A1V3NUZ4_9GAMM|nr:response regulator [Thioalkalivibrio denitrificans]OOG28773.1 DNA-binding response regulator [Thioalkalivibrio denitrificans]